MANGHQPHQPRSRPMGTGTTWNLPPPSPRVTRIDSKHGWRVKKLWEIAKGKLGWVFLIEWNIICDFLWIFHRHVCLHFCLSEAKSCQSLTFQWTYSVQQKPFLVRRDVPAEWLWRGREFGVGWLAAEYEHRANVTRSRWSHLAMLQRCGETSEVFVVVCHGLRPKNMEKSRSACQWLLF